MTYFKLMAGAVVCVLTVIIAALVLIGTSGGGDDDDGAVPQTATPQPTASFLTRGPTSQPTVTATPIPAGEESALEVPEAGGVVPLAPGNYRTSRFQPQAHFSLGEGWSANFDTARLVHLFRGDDPNSNCVCFISPDGVVSDNGGADEALPGQGTVDDMIDWLTANESLATSNPSSLQVGNLSGRQLDVEVQSGDEVEYLSAGSQRFKVVAGERQHLVVLANGESLLIIAQRSPAAEYSDYFGFVEDVVGGLTFTS
jgi:hypothetical protein